MRTTEYSIPGEGLSTLYAELTTEQTMAPENFPGMQITVCQDLGGELRLLDMDLQEFVKQAFPEESE